MRLNGESLSLERIVGEGPSIYVAQINTLKAEKEEALASFSRLKGLIHRDEEKLIERSTEISGRVKRVDQRVTDLLSSLDEAKVDVRRSQDKRKSSEKKGRKLKRKYVEVCNKLESTEKGLKVAKEKLQSTGEKVERLRKEVEYLKSKEYIDKVQLEGIRK